MRIFMAIWWEQKRVYVLIFCGWTPGYISDARDGTHVLVKSRLLRYIRRQRWTLNMEEKEQLIAKIDKVGTI